MSGSGSEQSVALVSAAKTWTHEESRAGCTPSSVVANFASALEFVSTSNTPPGRKMFHIYLPLVCHFFGHFARHLITKAFWGFSAHH